MAGDDMLRAGHPVRRFGSDRTSPLIVLGLALMASAASATTRVVGPDGEGDFPNIQLAINASAPGDTVELADGTFRGEGNRDLLITTAITLRSQSGDPQTCEIDCQGAAPGLTLIASPTIEGLGIQNAHGSRGGGIVCYGHPTIWRCVVKECSAYELGGGLFCEDFAGALVEDCVFEGNSADVCGGGVYCYEDESTFRRCRFTSNQSSPWGGGGIFCVGADTIEDCVFAGNTSGYYGGALSCGRGRVAGCTIWGSAGGGLSVGPTAVIENTIVAFGTSGPAVVCWSGTPTFVCCDLFGNAGGDWVECVADQRDQNGNISANPRFCDPEAGDFSVSLGSPCLPDYHPSGVDCGLIGAVGEGCAPPPAISRTTWGALKWRNSGRR
ncbi:MAG: right-handed parallel beta-helix repeat-containing protein [Candidatus Eisenbacteria bacterium]